MKDILDEFPYIGQTFHQFPNARTTALGHIVYLDNAATNQRPLSVITAMDSFHKFYNANVHRGIHWMSDTATENMERARQALATLINAESTRNIVLTSGTTHAINTVAYGLRPTRVLTTRMEHHANIVPWKLINAIVDVIDIDPNGNLVNAEQMIEQAPRGSLLALTHCSNVLGTINPVAKLIKLAHDNGLLVLVDGAQVIGHMPVDVQALDADFYCFSGHKMFGPMGTGVLYAKEHLLEQMTPMMGGGEMISSVSFEEILWSDLPYKFEAGTPNVSGIIGLGAAVDFIQKIGYEKIQRLERSLTEYAVQRLNQIDQLYVIGPEKRGSLVAFGIHGIHPHDVSQILDQQGIAVRSGNHCAEPLHKALGIPGSTRASFSIYNSMEDIDALALGIEKAKGFFI